MFLTNNSNILIGAVMAVILIFALISVVRTLKGGGCACVSGRSCDGDCARCDCTDCATAGRRDRGKSRGFNSEKHR